MDETPKTLSGPRVLVIDDDEEILALTRLALAKEGITVDTATSAADGLAQLAGGPDVVILDIVLGDLSGWEALRRIRETSDVPVMLLTGRDTDVDKARGLDLGADDYLTKPFSFLEFEARVRALLRRSGAVGRTPPGPKGEESRSPAATAPPAAVRLEADTDA